ncbi:hypothetical protein OUZ56_006918 [Daphnia magna]|uniref:Uncharacterized protein n=1 Tax=Daphnia magna TaxID=35525 RepID=A0ABQ9YX22_9CRUS|nr:hypothetical protein OUZ56_006918 [Daphnia magna]
MIHEFSLSAKFEKSNDLIDILFIDLPISDELVQKQKYFQLYVLMIEAVLTGRNSLRCRWITAADKRRAVGYNPDSSPSAGTTGQGKRKIKGRRWQALVSTPLRMCSHTSPRSLDYGQRTLVLSQGIDYSDTEFFVVVDNPENGVLEMSRRNQDISIQFIRRKQSIPSVSWFDLNFR